MLFYPPAAGPMLGVSARVTSGDDGGPAPLSKPKSRTRQAIEQNRRALVDAAVADTYQDRGDGWNAAHHRDMAAFHGKLTAELLAPPESLPDIRHGEVVPVADTNRALGLRDTLATPDMPAIDASIARTDLLLTEHLDVAAMAIDAAASIEARNPLEKMLAYQMAAAHAAAFKFMDKAVAYLDQIGRGRDGAAPVEAARLTNAAVRLMATYQQGLLTLQRLRTGGAQTVTVQHVHVGEGAQAVIGNVQTGRVPPPGGSKK